MLSVENIFDFSAFEDLSPKENFIKSTITKHVNKMFYVNGSYLTF